MAGQVGRKPGLRQWPGEWLLLEVEPTGDGTISSTATRQILTALVRAEGAARSPSGRGRSRGQVGLQGILLGELGCSAVAAQWPSVQGVPGSVPGSPRSGESGRQEGTMAGLSLAVSGGASAGCKPGRWPLSFRLGEGGQRGPQALGTAQDLLPPLWPSSQEAVGRRGCPVEDAPWERSTCPSAHWRRPGQGLALLAWGAAHLEVVTLKPGHCLMSPA